MEQSSPLRRLDGPAGTLFAGSALFVLAVIVFILWFLWRNHRLLTANPQSHSNVEIAASYGGTDEQEIRELQKALSIKDDFAIRANLGNAYEELGRFPEGVAEYNHALQLNPQYASAWCNMGYALMREGKLDEAIPDFMKAIEYDPRMPQGRTDLYKALQMRGIDPGAANQTGSYPFDLKKALELLKTYPPPGAANQPPER